MWVPVLQDPKLQLPCCLSFGLGCVEAPILKDQDQISWCVQGRVCAQVSSSMRVLVS